MGREQNVRLVQFVRTKGRDALIYRVEVAETWWQRLRGLIGRARLQPDEALLIRSCSAIHTFGMRFPIDVVFLDARGVVLKAVSNVRPWRVGPICLGSAAVLELPSGAIRQFGIRPGEHLPFLPAEEGNEQRRE